MRMDPERQTVGSGTDDHGAVYRDRKSTARHHVVPAERRARRQLPGQTANSYHSTHHKIKT